MNNRVFFDTNILIDLTNESNDIYEQTLFLFQHFIRSKNQLCCSPTSFAITYFFLSKSIKDRRKLNKTAIDFFSNLSFTREDNIIWGKVKNSNFIDLEDALQYYSAEDFGVNIIITKNFFHFKKSSIPVYHPLQYINEFLI